MIVRGEVVARLVQTFSMTTSFEGSIRVAIVEDDRGTRDGLAVLLGATPGFECVGTYGSVEEALSRAPPAQPEVVLLDIGLPGLDGSEGVARVRERYPGATVLMLTVFEDEDRIFESLCNGAAGYLLKKTPPARLLEAIREADGGGAPLSPEIARKVVRLFREVAPRPRTGEELTHQETRLLELLAAGHTYGSAADQMGVSVNTVRNYVRSVYQKLHVHTQSAAVGRALREGLI